MSLELLTKAVEDHGKAMSDFRESIQTDVREVKTHLKELEQEFTQFPRHALLSGAKYYSHNELAARFIESEQFHFMGKGAPTTGRVSLGELNIKALTNIGRGDNSSTGFDVQPQRAPGLYNSPQRPLTLLDMLPSIPVTTGVFEYLQLEGYSNNAAFQIQEGQQKAEASMPTTVTQAQVATIAHWIQASAQVIDDAPALTQQIGNLLRYGLLAKLESAIVAGSGGQGQIKGLIEQSVLFVPPAPAAAADAVGQAVTALQANGWNPGLIVLNPSDWFAIASEREEGKGQYVLGSPRDPAPLALWGVPVVTTPSLGVGTALVLDPDQVAILDRMQPTLLASRDDDRNLTSNLVTILAEMRAGLAVFALGAVVAVDIHPSTTA
ncbi:phage major capsid protein, HK97 family [Pseudomonas luteola]|nr:MULTISPECIES: phage major capsid protein [Pseudomonas]RRW48569.1 phage major capsid protein [Pseudomonas luteola]SHI92620.1 phage major capsid protein, HK97 family [Pseudomonas zeshuii]